MAFPETRIGFIGAGNMARAIIGGLLQAGHRPASIAAADPSGEARDRTRTLHPGLRLSDDNLAVAEGCEALVLAVKPQSLPTVAAALGPRPAGQLLLSIAAGARLASLRRWLGAEAALVRAMPNQPALAGAGMSVLVAGGGLAPEQRALAEYILQAAGETGWVDDESLLDAVTAISGSGPAYFYLLMEILEDSAREMGIPGELAARLARQTAYGAGLVAHDSALGLAELRESVTSPGGTTAAALASLEQAGYRAIVAAALRAARQRAVELGDAADDH